MYKFKKGDRVEYGGSKGRIITVHPSMCYIKLGCEECFFAVNSLLTPLNTWLPVTNYEQINRKDVEVSWADNEPTHYRIMDVVHETVTIKANVDTFSNGMKNWCVASEYWVIGHDINLTFDVVDGKPVGKIKAEWVK